jgi:GAF domain-containing protein
VVNNDFRTSLTGLPWRDEALRRGHLSSAAFPVIVGNRARGTLNVYTTMPDHFDDTRIRMLTELASELAAVLAGLVEPETADPESEPLPPA